jgi:hypothetical protein
MKKQILVLLLLILSGIYSYAQDTLRMKAKNVPCKVIEIGIDEIKYKEFDNLEGPVIVVDKRDVYEIRYQNGKKEIISKDAYEASPEVDIRYKHHAIKFEFFSPLTNDVAFGYETMLKVGMNLECKFGAIGPGFDQNMTPASGYFVKAGIKFLLSPTYYIRGVKYAHGLMGGYIKPESIYNSFTKNDVTFYNGAVNICFGKQQLLGNIITLDYYLGVGYGFQTHNFDNKYPGPYSFDYGYEGYAYSHTYGGPDFPIVFSAGLTLGYLF